MDGNLLKYKEKEELNVFKMWVDDILTSEKGLEFRASFEKSLYDADLDWPDVRFAITNCEAIYPGFGQGCRVISGSTVDGDSISVAVAINFSKDRLKILKVWRN